MGVHTYMLMESAEEKKADSSWKSIVFSKWSEGGKSTWPGKDNLMEEEKTGKMGETLRPFRKVAKWPSFSYPFYN